MPAGAQWSGVCSGSQKDWTARWIIGDAKSTTGSIVTHAMPQANIHRSMNSMLECASGKMAIAVATAVVRAAWSMP